jgi:hypothetical protein
MLKLIDRKLDAAESDAYSVVSLVQFPLGVEVLRNRFTVC